MPVEETEEKNGRDRRKRIKLLKRIIVITFTILLLLPTVLCAVLFYKLYRLNGRLDQLRTVMESQEERVSQAEEKAAEAEKRYSVEMQELQALPDTGRGETDSEQQAPTAERRVYLTFDDGPSGSTGEILDILQEYNVKATFFVVGKEEEAYRPLYQRIVDEGHTLGMHSYSHKYREIYQSVESYADDLNKLREFLFDITGTESRFCRFPGGSSNTVSKVSMQDLIAYLDSRNITYFDWNVACGDADSGDISVKQIVDNCTDKLGLYQNTMILMHDAADKKTTVEALPIIIDRILEKGDTEIVPVTDATEPIQHIKYQDKSTNGGI